LLKAEWNKVPVGNGQQGWTAIKKMAEESTATKYTTQCKMKYLAMFALMMVHGGVQTKAFLIIGTILAMFAKNTPLLLILMTP
jgi:hypothetical protein